MDFVLHLFKEIRSDVETWSTDRVIYLVRNVILEKAYRKPALKTTTIPLFNFGKQHKTKNACKKLQIYIFTYIQHAVYTCIYIQIYVYYIYIYIYVHHIYLYLYLLYMYTYIIYIYIYIYIHIYINIYIFEVSCMPLLFCAI